MRVSWKLGRVAGIDLFLHPSALLVLFLGSAMYGGDVVAAVPFVVALFGSIVLHELGHALMARRYGIGTRDITLYLIGGVARLERMPRSAGPELLIALAGPAVNVAIAAVLGATLLVGLAVDPGGSPGLADFLLQVVSLNVGLLLFNLLPVFPMDGGRVLRALLSGWLGRVRATEVAAGLGQFLAITGGLFGLFTGRWELAVLAAFVYFAAAAERRGVVAEARDPQRRGFINPPEAPLGFRWADRGDGVWRLVPALGRPQAWGR